MITYVNYLLMKLAAKSISFKILFVTEVTEVFFIRFENFYVQQTITVWFVQSVF